MVGAEQETSFFGQFLHAGNTHFATEIVQDGGGEIHAYLVAFLVEKAVHFVFVQDSPQEGDCETDFPIHLGSFFFQGLLDVDGSLGNGKRKHRGKDTDFEALGLVLRLPAGLFSCCLARFVSLGGENAF